MLVDELASIFCLSLSCLIYKIRMAALPSFLMGLSWRRTVVNVKFFEQCLTLWGLAVVTTFIVWSEIINVNRFSLILKK